MFKRLLGGLRGRLMAGFSLVILITATIIALVVQQNMLPRLDTLLILVSQRQAYQIVPFFAADYARTGSWVETARSLPELERSLPPELAEDLMSSRYPWQFDQNRLLLPNHVILTDAAGLVIANSRGDLSAGQPLPDHLQPYAVPIDSQEVTVGHLVSVPDFIFDLADVARRGFRRTLTGATLLAGAVALLTSVGLAYSLTRPLRRLSQAAQQLAFGDFHPPLPTPTEDEIGELTAAFNEMTQSLAIQKRLRQQMVADIAHELRTPLSIMQLEIESLADGLQGPDEAAASLQEEVTALERLIEDLRLLSLADGRGLHLDLKPLDLERLIERVAAAWQKQAQQRNIGLRVEITGPVPPVMADAGRLEQVLHNLVSNGLRYTPAGGHLAIGLRPASSEVILSVADNGPGIAAADVPHLFDRFYRTDPSRSRETGGSGLGLAITKQLVLLHDGRIWVESEVGEGTTFFIALPQETSRFESKKQPSRNTSQHPQ